MDVVHVVTVARRVRCALRRVRRALHIAPFALVLAPLALGACSESAPKEVAPEGPLGSVELNLVGQGTQGTLFRLR
ncbi:MAG TPA: hypothetical protein VMG12_36950, partial [Polyangiaceae bacterium]|nr:hypothetical protein [Polyangiaceae bacterium]